jgi:hypothetical protein
MMTATDDQGDDVEVDRFSLKLLNVFLMCGFLDIIRRWFDFM